MATILIGWPPARRIAVRGRGRSKTCLLGERALAALQARRQAAAALRAAASAAAAAAALAHGASARAGASDEKAALQRQDAQA